MTEAEKNTQESNPQKAGIWESFSQSFVQQIEKNIGFFIIPAIIIFMLWNIGPNPPIVNLTAVAAGTAAAAILPAVTGVPLTLAVGVGIVLWWIICSVMS